MLDIQMFCRLHLVSSDKAPFFGLDVSEVGWESFLLVKLVLFLVVDVFVEAAFGVGRDYLSLGISSSSWSLLLRLWWSYINHSFWGFLLPNRQIVIRIDILIILLLLKHLYLSILMSRTRSKTRSKPNNLLIIIFELHNILIKPRSSLLYFPHAFF
jgi:hypothetical protein